jgi:hypothetical protein
LTTRAKAAAEDARRRGRGNRDVVQRKGDLKVVTARRGREVGRQVADEIGHVEAQGIVLEQTAMHRGHRGHPFEHGLQRGLGRLVGGSPALQQDHRGDQLQIVLHPMVDLMQQGGLLGESQVQRIGADGGLRGAIVRNICHRCDVFEAPPPAEAQERQWSRSGSRLGQHSPTVTDLTRDWGC